MGQYDGWKCTVSGWVQSQTDTTATIRVVSYWQNIDWRYDIGNVSSWVYCNGAEHQVMNGGHVDTSSSITQSQELGYYDFTVDKLTSGQNIPVCAKITSNSSYASGTRWSGDTNVWVGAKTSYTVSYNANGGSGAPGSQTKWHGTNLTLSSTKPTKTGHTFVRWNTNTSNTGTAYNPGGSYTGNANLTLYAIWKANTWNVKYDANGGSGAPAAQTKTYGVTLKLSTTKPTKTNYNFLGWATSAGGSVVYAPGANYTNNSAVTLYAVWELAYTKPRLTSFWAQRCNSAGAITETGTYVKVTFDWATDKTVTAVKIQYKLQTATDWNTTNVTASGTSGTVNYVFGNGGFNTEKSYSIRAYVSDGSGDNYTTYSTTVSIGTVKFPIDVKAGGTGVAIGKVAEDDKFDVAMPTVIRESLQWESGYAAGTDYNSIINSGIFYMSENCANAPINYCRLLSMGRTDSGDSAQLAVYVTNGQIYSRGRSNGNWHGWSTVLQTQPRSAGSNFNDLTKTGVYLCAEVPNGSNVPMSHISVLEVFNSGNAITQRFTNWNGVLVWQRGYYNGSWSTWYYVGSTIMATCYPSSRYEVVSNAWENIKINCNAELCNTSLGLLTLSDGGIRIGKNINTIKISASLNFYYFDAQTEIDLKIYKNTDTVGNIYGNSINNLIFNSSTNPIAINVKEGDIIYLYMVKGSPNNLQILNNVGSTSLTVEVVN